MASGGRHRPLCLAPGRGAAQCRDGRGDASSCDGGAQCRCAAGGVIQQRTAARGGSRGDSARRGEDIGVRPPRYELRRAPREPRLCAAIWSCVAIASCALGADDDDDGH